MSGTQEAVATAQAATPVPPASDVQLNVYNFASLMAQEPARYDALRFDPNNTCNLRCVYCHNHRNDEVIDEAQFREFLHSKVVAVQTFQVGCIMEPTLDKRLADMMLEIAASPARPQHDFLLQTNGLLLHRHDQAKMREAGLTRLSVSLDAVDAETQKDLRSGTSLQKVLRNVREFMAACPQTRVEFICTVTRLNVDKVEDLIAAGLEIGIERFIFREVFYYPDNDVVDHTRMPDLVLLPGQFRAMMERVLARHEGDAEFIFADNEFLHSSAKRMISDSQFVARDLGERYGEPAPDPEPEPAAVPEGLVHSPAAGAAGPLSWSRALLSRILGR